MYACLSICTWPILVTYGQPHGGMFVCMYVCMYVFMYEYVGRHYKWHVCVHLFTHTYIHTYKHNTHIHTYIHICMHACIQAESEEWRQSRGMDTCTASIYMHAYIPTHKQTNILTYEFMHHTNTGSKCNWSRGMNTCPAPIYMHPRMPRHKHTYIHTYIHTYTGWKPRNEYMPCTYIHACTYTCIPIYIHTYRLIEAEAVDWLHALHAVEQKYTYIHTYINTYRLRVRQKLRSGHMPFTQ